jgi:heat shock protein HslJ
LTSKEDIITISFANDTIFKGHLSRNTYLGQYYSHDDNIRFNKSIAETKICCDNKMDDSFLTNLRMTNKFFIKGNHLFLISKLATLILNRVE